ncbi:hypothetical protein QQS21_009401 [Conoideocrella luteorostrata]|uniref:Uncharacterized protein n=1 Tax=Conoideocrella luteorostrata TaxID=1105319 RepID=A0AAJ0CH32_9HYPO|nr:hypothetical protein QQS21_009401 [Conoideocrella luteorostrata]
MSSSLAAPINAIPRQAKVAELPAEVLGSDFPKPQGNFDIEVALKQKPPRWTYQGQVEANKSRVTVTVAERERKQNLERAKKDLLAMHDGLNDNFKSKEK